MIPIDAPVRLEFEKERKDRYGRAIAGNSINLYNAADLMDVARVAAAALLQTLEHNRADMTRTALTPEEQAQLEDQARTVNGTASREENALRRAAISASSREAEAARASGCRPVTAPMIRTLNPLSGDQLCGSLPDGP